MDKMSRERMIVSIALWILASVVGTATAFMVGGFVAANYIGGCVTGWLMHLLVSRVVKART
jgi:membrane associated rhomboid family serine protease